MNKFTLNNAYREFKSNEWRSVLAALTLAIMLISALQLFTDRLNKTIKKQSAVLIGGDLSLSSPTPIDEKLKSVANQLNLKTADQQMISTMAMIHDEMQIITLQAVSSNYPLLSATRLNLKSHTILVEPRLLNNFNLKLNDKIQIGRAWFTIAGIIENEFDIASSAAILGPKVVIRLEDLPSTQIMVPGVRAEYRLLLSGANADLKTFKQQIRLSAGQRLVDIDSQEFVLSQTIGRITQFFEISILITVTMCAIAIAISLRQYLRNQFNTIALWRVLGATRRQILSNFINLLLAAVIIAGLIGMFGGYLLDLAINYFIFKYTSWILVDPQLIYLSIGFAAGFILLLMTAYNVLIDVTKITPLAIWRTETTKAPKTYGGMIILFITSAIVFIYLFFNLTLFTFFILDLILFSVALLYVINLLILKLFKLLIPHLNGSARRGIANLTQHPDTTGLLFTGIALILILLLALNSIRANLLNDFNKTIDPQSPNFFVINLTPQDLTQFRSVLTQSNINIDSFYPIVRGRLVGKNNASIVSADHNALRRDLNLSEMTIYPSDNKILQGHLPNSQQTDTVSVEKSLAEALNLKIGDSLDFLIAGNSIKAKVINIRDVNWKSFHPNFYIIFYPGTFKDLPITYMTSFYLPESAKTLTKTINQQFPNATIFDIASILKQVQQVTSYLIYAMQFLFLFSFVAAVILIYVTLRATQNERDITRRLLMTIGASKQFVRQSNWVEGLALTAMIITVSATITYGLYNHLLLGFFINN